MVKASRYESASRSESRSNKFYFRGRGAFHTFQNPRDTFQDMPHCVAARHRPCCIHPLSPLVVDAHALKLLTVPLEFKSAPPITNFSISHFFPLCRSVVLAINIWSKTCYPLLRTSPPVQPATTNIATHPTPRMHRPPRQHRLQYACEIVQRSKMFRLTVAALLLFMAILSIIISYFYYCCGHWAMSNLLQWASCVLYLEFLPIDHNLPDLSDAMLCPNAICLILVAVIWLFVIRTLFIYWTCYKSYLITSNDVETNKYMSISLYRSSRFLGANRLYVHFKH